MKKKIIISSIVVGIVLVFSLLLSFFQFELFLSNTDVGLSNYKVEGTMYALGGETKISIEVDGKKSKQKTLIGNLSLETYTSEEDGVRYLYAKNILGVWKKTEITTEEDITGSVSVIEDIKREDFDLVTIGYYTMTKDELEERNLEYMNIIFGFGQIRFDFGYNSNLYFSVEIKDIGSVKVNLPN